MPQTQIQLLVLPQKHFCKQDFASVKTGKKKKLHPTNECCINLTNLIVLYHFKKILYSFVWIMHQTVSGRVWAMCVCSLKLRLISFQWKNSLINSNMTSLLFHLASVRWFSHPSFCFLGFFLEQFAMKVPISLWFSKDWLLEVNPPLSAPDGLI